MENTWGFNQTLRKQFVCLGDEKFNGNLGVLEHFVHIWELFPLLLLQL